MFFQDCIGHSSVSRCEPSFISRFGFELSSPVNYYTKNYHFAFNENGLNNIRHWSSVFSIAVLDILVLFVLNESLNADLFYCEYWITQLLRMGLLFPERGGFSVTDNLFALHNNSEEIAR